MAATRLLDTSILSDIMKGHDGRVAARALRYLEEQQCFTFSILTRFEILRGLEAKNARAQSARFEQRCEKSHVLDLSDAMIVEGARIYGDLHRRGLLISDAGILIAATAKVLDLRLVTENPAHFERVHGIEIESWRASAVRG